MHSYFFNSLPPWETCFFSKQNSFHFYLCFLTLFCSVFQENPPPRANSAPPRELPGVPSKLSLEKRRGSTVTSRIREREAEFQKQVQDREEQITHLKDRLTILSQKLVESKEKDFKFPRDPRDREKVLLNLKEDGVELQNVLKQVFFFKFSKK